MKSDSKKSAVNLFKMMMRQNQPMVPLKQNKRIWFEKRVRESAITMNVDSETDISVVSRNLKRTKMGKRKQKGSPRLIFCGDYFCLPYPRGIHPAKTSREAGRERKEFRRSRPLSIQE